MRSSTATRMARPSIALNSHAPWPLIRRIPGVRAFLLSVLCGSRAGATTALFIGGGAEPTSGEDGDVMSHLVGRYGSGNVTYLPGDDSDSGDEDGFDVLVISSTVSSGDVRGKFDDSPVPVVTWEKALCDNDQPGDFGVTTMEDEETGSNHGIRILVDHPITVGFPVGQVVPLVDRSTEVSWSTAPAAVGVIHLAEDEDSPSRRFLSIIEEGGTLYFRLLVTQL